jgi:hypothetical protein
MRRDSIYGAGQAGRKVHSKGSSFRWPASFCYTRSLEGESVKISVERSDLTFEAGFPQPEFGLIRDASALLQHVYARLQTHGLKLSDLRIERGNGTVGDYHVLCYLFEYVMTIRIRAERIEVICSMLPNPEALAKYKAAILDLLRAVQEFKANLVFRAFAVAVNVHAKLEGTSVREYLSSFVTHVPKGLGTPAGNGVAFYFGPEGERTLATLTLENSALVADALFVRIHGVWDAAKAPIETLTAGLAEGFVNQALQSLGLEQG